VGLRERGVESQEDQKRKKNGWGGGVGVGNEVHEKDQKKTKLMARPR
jgi:hypothetical protein